MQKYTVVIKTQERNEVKENEKSNFAAMILGTIGMVFFALGMCMALIEEWGMFHQGIVSGVIGLVGIVVLLMLIPLKKGLK